MMKNGAVLTTIIVISVSVLLAMGLANFTRKISEANEVRSFQASIVSVQTARHTAVDCAQLNEFSKETNVLRVHFDHPVNVWSENGTGEGESSFVEDIDLRMNTGNDLKLPIGMGIVTFRYGASFLSVCDKQHIPIVSRFDFSF